MPLPHPTTRPRRRGRPPASPLSLLSASLLVAMLLAPLRAAAAEPDPVPISDGALVWGIKESFRDYIGEEGLLLSEGATQRDDGQITFPLRSGSYDAATQRTTLQFGGVALFDAYGGILHLHVANPRVVIDSEGSTLHADLLDSDGTTSAGVDLALLDHEAGGFSHDDGVTTWTGIPARLTAAGVVPFGGYYTPGQLIDPVSVTYTGPGSVPPVFTEEWTPARTPAFDATAELRTGRGTQWTVAGTDARGEVLFATRSREEYDGGVLTHPRLRIAALDARTLKVLDLSDRVDEAWGASDAWVSPVSGRIFVSSTETAGTVYVFTWDRSHGFDLQARINGDGRFVTSKTYLTHPQGEDVLFSTGASSGSDKQVTRFTETATGTWTGVSKDLAHLAVPSTTSVEDGVTRGTTGVWGGVLAAPDGTLLVSRAATDFEMRMEPLSFATTGRMLPIEAVDFDTLEQVTLEAGTAWSAPGDDRTTYGVAWDNASLVGPDRLVVSNGGQVRRALQLDRDEDGRWRPAGDRIDLVAAGTLSRRTPQQLGSGRLLIGSGDTTSVTDERGTALTTVPGTGAFALDDETFVTAPRAGAEQTGLIRYESAGESPSVTTQPADVAVSIGVGGTEASATLRTEVAGAPAPDLQWQTRDPGTTSAAAWRDLPDATGSRVDLTLAPDDHRRQFRVVAGNEHGRLASAPATATVLAAPVVLGQPAPAVVNAGQDATFTVLASGNPEPDVRWQRRVGGFWQDLDAAHDGVSVTGAVLTITSTDESQDGTLVRARLANEVATVHTDAARLSVTRPSEVAREITGGSVEWGVKESFRSYVRGPVAGGEVTVGDGAVLTPDDTVRFGVRDGRHDPAGSSLSVRLRGSVSFSGHGGDLDVRISDPVLRMTGTEGVLVADVVSKDLDSGTLRTYPRVELATVAAAGRVTATPERVLVSRLPATLTAAGSPAFAGFYGEGTDLDPVHADLVLGRAIDADGEEPPAPRVPSIRATWQRTAFPHGTGTRVRIRVTVPDVVPTGRVSLRVAGRTHTASLAAGRATLRVPGDLAVGRHPVVVRYAGADGIRPGTVTGTLRVTKARPRVRLGRVSVLPSGHVLVRSRVVLPGSARVAPAGRVEIRNGARVLATAPLRGARGGTVALRLPRLGAGEHRLRAVVPATARQRTGRSPVRVVRVG